MPLRVGCHRAVQIFYTDYSRNTLETTRFGFDKGGGHYPCSILWRDTCPSWLSVEVSYAAPQAHGIVNIALHRKYSPGIIFIFSQGRNDLYHV
jgi:hypothetical protein